MKPYLENLLHAKIEDVEIIIHLEDKEFFIKKKKIDDVTDDGDDADAEETLASYHSAKMNNFEVDVNKSSAAAIMRGVTIEWLIDWTNKKDCWNMPTWMVKVKFIVPETAKTRCRYSELESSRKSGAFGKADTFVSHCWVRMGLSHLIFIDGQQRTKNNTIFNRVQNGDLWLLHLQSMQI